MTDKTVTPPDPNADFMKTPFSGPRPSPFSFSHEEWVRAEAIATRVLPAIIEASAMTTWTDYENETRGGAGSAGLITSRSAADRAWAYAVAMIHAAREHAPTPPAGKT